MLRVLSPSWYVVASTGLLLSLIASFCLGALVPTASRLALCGTENPLHETVSRSRPAVVTLVAFNPGVAMPVVGVAFFVAPDRLVSSRHLLAGADRAEVRTASGETLRVGGILAEDRPHDLVLLQVERRSAAGGCLELSLVRPTVGSRVSTIGAPLGFEWSISDGLVSAYRDVPDGGTLMQHTAQISVGNSGGPIIDAFGRVVAVQVATMTEDKATIAAGQGLNFAVLARHVAALRAGPLQPLAACARDLPAPWVARVTTDIAKLALRPLTCDGFDNALAYFEERTVRLPDDPDAWFRLALCQEITGQLAKARASYLKVIALRPSFALALGNLGHVYIQLGLYDEAERVLRKALEADGRLALASGSLAFVLYRTGRYPQALESARSALGIDPNHPGARYIKALCSARAGDQDGARECAQVLESLDPRLARKLRSELGDANSPKASQTGAGTRVRDTETSPQGRQHRLAAR